MTSSRTRCLTAASPGRRPQPPLRCRAWPGAPGGAAARRWPSFPGSLPRRPREPGRAALVAALGPGWVVADGPGSAGSWPGRHGRSGGRTGPAASAGGPWENFLPGEIRRGALEDLISQLELPRSTAQLSKLLLLRAGQLYRPAILISVGLGHPVAQAVLAGNPGPWRSWTLVWCPRGHARPPADGTPVGVVQAWGHPP